MKKVPDWLKTEIRDQIAKSNMSPEMQRGFARWMMRIAFAK